MRRRVTSTAGVFGASLALVAGLIAGAPSVSAEIIDGAVSSQVLFSNPKVRDEQLALSSGARRPRLTNATLPMVGGPTTYRTIFRPGAGFTWDSAVMQILTCPNAETLRAADCRLVSEKELPGPYSPTITRSDDLTIDLGDRGYGRVHRGNLKITSGGATVNILSQAYYGAMQQPKALLPPVMLGPDGRVTADIDLASEVGYVMALSPWTFLPATAVEPERSYAVWFCPAREPSQVETYEWDSSACTLNGERRIATTGSYERSAAFFALDRAVLAGQYLVVEDTLTYSSSVAGGVSVVTRSAAYPMVDSQAGQQVQGQGQGQQGQGQQGQGLQGQQGEQDQGQQGQDPGAGQGCALAEPSGRAATLLRVTEAPLVSCSGVGTVDGTTFTIDAPQSQTRVQQKALYRAIVDPKYRGRVALVLTRTTAKAKKMIVAKRTVRQTKKNGTAQIRWKMSTRMPAGTYTLYASFIPKQKYGKQGLTVSAPVVIN